jgi:hypothetical protein
MKETAFLGVTFQIHKLNSPIFRWSSAHSAFILFLGIFGGIFYNNPMVVVIRRRINGFPVHF